MIAKRPRVRSVKDGAGVKLGGMKGLVQYVTRANIEGVEPLTAGAAITNSSAETIEDFIVQVDLIQRRNPSRQSKVYHLVVSFPAHEHPSPKVLRDIEQTLCEAINAGEHQRLSVVHDDTDCLHMHIAINRVHPRTFKLNAIHKDYAALQAACELLEARHGLARTNHEMTRSAGEGRARSVTLHHGQTPVLERAQAMAPALLAAQSWAEMHAHLADADMELRLRGAGLVVVAGDVGVKASSVAKGLSLGNLQGRLGPFQPARETPEAGQRRRREPHREGGREPGRPGSYRELRRQFYSERAVTITQRQEEWGQVRQARATAMEAVRATATERQAGLGSITPGPGRWALAAAVRQERAAQLAQVRAEARERASQARRRLGSRPPTSWVDWLRAKAAAGDVEALAALRRAGAVPPADGASWLGGGQEAGGAAAGVEAPGRAQEPSQAAWSERLRHVSRQGVVTYQVGRTRVRDDGDRLHLQGQPSDEAIAVALQLAKERHGVRLNVQGDLALRSRIAHVAARIDPSLRFDDGTTERLRAASVAVQKERRDGETQRRGAGGRGRPGGDGGGLDVGRPPRRSGVGDGVAVHVAGAYSAAAADRSSLATLRGRYPSGGIRAPVGLGNQPHLAATGAQSPSGDRAAWPGRRLRNLPVVDLVRRPEHGAMPLPAPDGRDLGDGPAGGDLAVRRAGAGDRAGDAAKPGDVRGGLSAVDRYVAERNTTRARVSGLQLHRPYAPDQGPMTFNGRRLVDGQTLALLSAGSEVLVMAVHPDQLARISRFKPGQSVDVREGRLVTPRGANTSQHPADTSISDSGQVHGRGPTKSGPRR